VETFLIRRVEAHPSVWEGGSPAHAGLEREREQGRAGKIWDPVRNSKIGPISLKIYRANEQLLQFVRHDTLLRIKHFCKNMTGDSKLETLEIVYEYKTKGICINNEQSIGVFIELLHFTWPYADCGTHIVS
jgi:hypothetical protein